MNEQVSINGIEVWALIRGGLSLPYIEELCNMLT